MRLTKQTSYALRILIHCALLPGEQVRAADIAQAYNITEANILKIIPLLVQAGFVRSIRGRRGGLKLARPASEISVGDIVRSTEETHISADCFGQTDRACPILPGAPINRIFGAAIGAFIEVLDQHSLQDLVSARRPRPGRQSAPALETGLALD